MCQLIGGGSKIKDQEENKMYKKIIVCGLALLMCGCSSVKASGNSQQTLMVGLNSEMNGTFSPMYYQTTNDSYVVDLVYQGLLKYDKKANYIKVNIK